MFAVMKTGGKQYRVAVGDQVKVEKLAGDAGDILEFGEVMMVGDQIGIEVYSDKGNNDPIAIAIMAGAAASHYHSVENMVAFAGMTRANGMPSTTTGSLPA